MPRRMRRPVTPSPGGPLADRPVPLTIVSALLAILGVVLLRETHSFWIGLSCAVFFGGCALVGLGGVIDRSRERSAERGEHVSPRSVTPALMVVASLALGVGCGLMALLVGTGAIEPDRRYGLFIVPIGAVGFLFFGGGGVALLFRLLRDR